MEAGNWKPYNVDYLERNIRQVFESGDIGKLTKATYEFIHQHMGFIAHYDLMGFQGEYANRLDDLRLYLQTSEFISRDPDYNLRWADKCEFDRQFVKWYGEAYCRSEAEGIRRIVAVARSQSTQSRLPFSALDLAEIKERR